jgi:hypothetical protein
VSRTRGQPSLPSLPLCKRTKSPGFQACPGRAPQADPAFRAWATLPTRPQQPPRLPADPPLSFSHAAPDAWRSGNAYVARGEALAQNTGLPGIGPLPEPQPRRPNRRPIPASRPRRFATFDRCAPFAPHPHRDCTVTAPLLHRYLTVVPLQTLQRYYGEVTVW